jgi:UDP-2,3-diacylglucosamine pyrophosphatase LpxH
MDMRTLILSDVHLGSKHSQVQRLRSLLDHESFDRLILNGDTLHSLNLRKLDDDHWDLLTRFRDLARQRELVLIRGNHDHDWLAERDRLRPLAAGVNGTGAAPAAGADALTPGFRPLDVLPALLGVPFQEEYRLEVDGKPYLVTHGDRFDPSLNTSLTVTMAGWCYQMSRKLNKKLARWLKKGTARWSRVLAHIRQQAAAHAHRQDCAGVLLGHTHHADDAQVEGVHYVNSGCWTESPLGYVTVAGGRLELHQIHE